MTELTPNMKQNEYNYDNDLLFKQRFIQGSKAPKRNIKTTKNKFKNIKSDKNKNKNKSYKQRISLKKEA